MFTVSAPMAVTTTASSVTYSFTGLTLAGFNFLQLSPAVSQLGPLVGTLTSVSIDAVLDASVNFTYANDLTIFVKELPLTELGGELLQVCGFSSLGAAERHICVNGESPAPGTPTNVNYTLITSLAFLGDGSDPGVFLGNGYSPSNSNGTWSGSVTLNGIAPIPEPSTTLMLALGGLGLAGWVARRRRAEDALQ
jgi:hypothetical protein